MLNFGLQRYGFFLIAIEKNMGRWLWRGAGKTAWMARFFHNVKKM